MPAILATADKKRQKNFLLPEEIIERLGIEAVSQRRTETSIVIEALEYFFSNPSRFSRKSGDRAQDRAA